MEEAKSIWGPRMWAEIHSTAAKSTPTQFRKYLGTLGPRIPCEECRYHLRSYIFSNPLTNFEDPMIWSIDFHNVVNKRLGKRVLTYQEAYEQVKVYRVDSTYNMIIIALLIGMIVCIVHKKML
tara:strand:- start:345 stop:713 length:369 start_codon:yes stop_codon:yes gene_type:complete